MGLLSLATDGMPPKPLRLISAYYASTKVKVRAKWRRLSVLGVSLWHSSRMRTHPYMVDWYLGPALQVTPGIQVGTSVHVSDLYYVLKL